MARVYAVASAKGGVGKTTLTANLGVTLAAAGLDVAVVDADMGMPNLGRLVGVSPDGPTLHDVLAGDVDPLDAVYEGPEGVAVVPGEPTLDAYATVDPRELRSVVDALDTYDITLLDTGAGLSHDTVLPLGLADTVLLVSTPSPDALGDTEKTRQVAERLDVPVVGLALTRVDTERVDVEAIRARVEPPVVGVIPEDPLDADSTGGLAVTRDTDSAVAAAYRELAASIAPADADLGFDAPAAPDLEDSDGGGTAGDDPDSSDVDVDLSSVLDDTSEGPVDGLDDAFDLDDDTDEDDGSGLASMLADAESSADTSEPASTTDVVVEAEPGPDTADASETASDADDTHVTFEPDDEADIPDAESGTDTERRTSDDNDSDHSDAADDDETDKSKKGGLFSRFFG